MNTLLDEADLVLPLLSSQVRARKPHWRFIENQGQTSSVSWAPASRLETS